MGAQQFYDIDDDGDFIAKAHHLRRGGRQTNGVRQREANMLVLRMAVELTGRRLQDMGRWRTAGGNTPSAVLKEQCRLGLRASKTELPRVSGQTPCGMVFPQIKNFSSITASFPKVGRTVEIALGKIVFHDLS